MQTPKHIFKAYDIRGLVDGELSEELAYRIGRSFVHLLRNEGVDFKGSSIVVGHDMRETSIPFQKCVMQGITDEGVDVVNIGLTSTPVFNFACAHIATHVGGIMITASHNPSEYNGFKITRGNGLPVGKGTGMEDIRDMSIDMEFDAPRGGGVIGEKDVRGLYEERIFSLVNTEEIAPLHIVIDGGNGMGNVTFSRWLKKLPVTVTYMYMEPDGTFPNHEANPLKVETLTDLQAKVLEVGADFGFALDGDADRLGLVDEKGVVVDASYVAALIGLEVLKKNPGAHMLYDLRSSQSIPELWEAAGATTQKSTIGHALIKVLMKETQAIFASELSLHLYYGDMYNMESTDLSLLYVLYIASREKKPLSDIIAPMKTYAHSGEFNFEVEDKDGVMKRIKEIYAEEANEILEIDGIWMRMPWGWFSVRKSNTEPVLRLNLETHSEEETRMRVAELKKYIVS
ncbi:MAG: phosphomannomutase/phosphoglucomutase [Candidatus Magasanikbacteria bacterium CG10_big_fil_rev_8_21_14_0_10_43_6]|uniref:Phosphomannomutase/phosphoglucomutase n=1 Tax=Candidatus Magasanikbacteria bacterium CG10_big_fil_rev_8_21_14_0_10_43_6 TaxID=1974650 RepID=A0A2M6W2F3_9BACT|nr:MAG: phosphomannomutase/phosphoglucomutase [Candidatus Magasanikbacteria bacterium CG10_big_fil_rev_8_21_14_0_10_43_6]